MNLPEKKHFRFMVSNIEASELQGYDRYVVSFSGGKDSLACLAYLVEAAVDRRKIELWHNDVDGREGSSLFDWPCTRSYVEKIAQAFNVPIYFSWRKHGFEGELLRDNALTNAVIYQGPNGKVELPATDRPGLYNTRRKFPQVSADLSVRWCSSALKIDVAGRALCNDLRFREGRTLFITGERAEESANRARYNRFEPHKQDLKHGRTYQRYIDHLRPVLFWKERDIWGIIEKFKIHPHPAYYLGFSRTSCMTCIFLNQDGFRTVQFLDPDRFKRLVQLEKEFGVTIKRNISLSDYAGNGSVFPINQKYVSLAMSEQFSAPIFTEEWELPTAAYKKGCGPS